MKTTQTIQLLLAESGLDHSHEVANGHDKWSVPLVKGHVGVDILLVEDGDYLLFRTSPMFDLRNLPSDVHHQLPTRAMKVNDEIMLGRFVGDQVLCFEIPLWLNGDAVLTRQQFDRALATAMNTLIEAPRLLDLKRFAALTAAAQNGQQATAVPESILERLRSVPPSKN